MVLAQVSEFASLLPLPVPSLPPHLRGKRRLILWVQGENQPSAFSASSPGRQCSLPFTAGETEAGKGEVAVQRHPAHTELIIGTHCLLRVPVRTWVSSRRIRVRMGPPGPQQQEARSGPECPVLS